MRRPRRVRLDFVAPLHRSPLAGAVLCAAGVAAVLAVGVAFDRQLAERDRLEAALETIPRARPAAAPGPEATRRAAEAAAVARELAVPWARLLAELEAASHDSAGRVSLLEVEPDPGRREVRITAEVRALDDALAYLRRLQRGGVLQNPMLESHERRRNGREHPLRVKLSAEWHT